MATHSRIPVTLPEIFHGHGSLLGYNPWVHKELDMTKQLTLWASQVALVVKNLPANAGDMRDADLILGLERSPEGGHDNPLQYSCLDNPMERGAWQAIVSERVEHD